MMDQIACIMYMLYKTDVKAAECNAAPYETTHRCIQLLCISHKKKIAREKIEE